MVLQVPGDDEPVATVVPGPAEDEDALAVGVESEEELGGTAAGVLHEDDAGHAVLVDGPAVQVADLGARQPERGHDLADSRGVTWRVYVHRPKRFRTRSSRNRRPKTADGNQSSFAGSGSYPFAVCRKRSKRKS